MSWLAFDLISFGNYRTASSNYVGDIILTLTPTHFSCCAELVSRTGVIVSPAMRFVFVIDEDNRIMRPDTTSAGWVDKSK